MRKKNHNEAMKYRKQRHDYEIEKLKEKYEEQLKALPEILENLELVKVRVVQEAPKVYKLVTTFDPHAMQAMFCHGYNDDPYFEYLSDHIAHKIIYELKHYNITRDFKCERG